MDTPNHDTCATSDAYPKLPAAQFATLTISAAMRGGYIVLHSAGQSGYMGDLLFAGSLNECLGFVGYALQREKA